MKLVNLRWEMTDDERKQAQRNAGNDIETLGSGHPLAPPSNLRFTAGSRKATVYWDLPASEGALCVRVYRGTEYQLYAQVPAQQRSCDVACSAGPTPPWLNVFLSRTAAGGADESAKVCVQVHALVEAGAPAEPAPPPGAGTAPPGDPPPPEYDPRSFDLNS